MKILVIGSGGREHALCWKLAQSTQVDSDVELYAAPGNPGIAAVATCVPVVPGSSKLAMDKVRALLPTILDSGKPAVIAALGDEFPIPPEFIAGTSWSGQRAKYSI